MCLSNQLPPKNDSTDKVPEQAHCGITQVPVQVVEPNCMASEVLHGERGRK